MQHNQLNHDIIFLIFLNALGIIIEQCVILQNFRTLHHNAENFEKQFLKKNC